jgi:hypothetical protein
VCIITSPSFASDSQRTQGHRAVQFLTCFLCLNPALSDQPNQIPQTLLGIRRVVLRIRPPAALLCLDPKNETQEPFGHVLIICYEHLMDRGWSMNLSSAFLVLLFALAIAGIAQANDQQAQQSCVNAAICLLAVRSGLSPGRRSDLQVHYTSLALGDRHGLIGIS